MRVRDAARLGAFSPSAAGLATAGIMSLGRRDGAQTPQPLKIALLGGLSGVYADIAQGQVEAMQLAVDDVGGKVLGRPIEVLSADHQNKPDIAAAVARKWYDEGVKMISGLDTSSVGLAVRKVAQEKGQIDLNVGSATADLTGPACSATVAHWSYDTYELAHVTGSAVVKDGGDTWFFLTADYAFGKSMEDEATKVVTAAGGKVIGGVKHPISTQDFSSYMLQAQASKAKIVGPPTPAATRSTPSSRAASRPGQGGQRIAALLIFESDVQSARLADAQGWSRRRLSTGTRTTRRAPGPSVFVPSGTSCPTSRRRACTAPRCTISRPCRRRAPTSRRP